VPITPDRAAPRAAAPAPAKPLIGDYGLDLSAGNHSVRPGDDFFAYANGAWYERFTIPADHASFGPFDTLDELSKQRVRAIIEEAAAPMPPAALPAADRRFLRGLHGRGRDRGQGLAPVQADLQRIAAATTRQGLAHLFGEPGFASLFDVQLPADFKNPDRYSVFITQATLGLPDRDYYLKDDPQLKALRGKYVAYIAQMLTLGGASDAAARARDIHGVRGGGGAGPVADREAPRCGGHLQPAQQAAAARLRARISWQAFLRGPATRRPAGAGARRVRGHS